MKGMWDLLGNKEVAGQWDEVGMQVEGCVEGYLEVQGGLLGNY